MASATENDICKRVGQRIRDLRQEREWSQQLLADHAQIERAHLSRLEDGKREAGLRVLEKIAIALDVDVAELLRR
jgi:transcriptional regulator with XRE-family HTH domain